MAFLESRLDTRIERGASGGPSNRGRTKVYTASGKLRQTFGWSAPLHQWDVSHGLRSAADLESLRAMWYVVNFTPYEGFRFRDWSDYIATQVNSALVFITGSTWQLQRVYTYASISFARDIKKPVASPAPVVYRNRAGSVSNASASVDATTGIATIPGHLAGDTYTWDGQFDVPVTFADEQWVQQIEALSGNGALAMMPTISLEEIRLA